jgi:hypothetical protein
VDNSRSSTFADPRAGRREPQEGDAGKRHQVETEPNQGTSLRIGLQRPQTLLGQCDAQHRHGASSSTANTIPATAADRRLRQNRAVSNGVSVVTAPRPTGVAVATRSRSSGSKWWWSRSVDSSERRNVMRSWCQGEDLCGASPAKGLARSGVEFGLENRPTERGLWRGPADRAPGPPRRRREDRSRLAEAQAGMEG